MASVAGAALCLPVTSAWAPGAGMSIDAPAAAQPPTPFAPALQLADRTLQDPALAELSGLAASRLHPGVLYGINDSGNDAVVFAIDGDGNTVGRLTLPKADNRDWEAIAPGIDDRGQPVLWIGDIGDNGSARPYVRLLRVAEPASLGDQRVAWQEYRLAYPDGPHNAEALAVDPRDGTMWVITKRTSGPGGVYRVPADLRTGRVNAMEYVMEAPTEVTDGAWELSPVGEPRLVLCGYWQLFRWDGSAWVSAIGPLQAQREALAWPWLPAGQRSDSVLLGSEGAKSTIVAGKVPGAK